MTTIYSHGGCAPDPVRRMTAVEQVRTRKSARRLRLRRLLFCFWLIVTPGSLAWSCNVPVFRYALEHWRPDTYRAVLFHRGELPKNVQEELDGLVTEKGGTQVNIKIRTVDLDRSPAPQDLQLWTQATRLAPANQQDPDLPTIVIQYPAYLQLEQPVWVGRFNGPELSRLLDSPARQDLLERLSGGQTGVWLLVESGDPAEDAAAVALLETELQELARTLKLPELTDSPEDVIQDGPPMRVEFTLLRVRRDDVAEQYLISLLLGCEADLVTLNEPIVFPIFGRCRALLPLVGPGISKDTIRSSAAFLAGACSCQVKELNPGFDLLVTANWSKLLPWAQSPASASLINSHEPALEAEFVQIPAGTIQPVSDVTRDTSATPAATSLAQSEPSMEDSSPTAPTTLSRTIAFILGSLFLAWVLATSVRRC